MNIVPLNEAGRLAVDNMAAPTREDSLYTSDHQESVSMARPSHDIDETRAENADTANEIRRERDTTNKKIPLMLRRLQPHNEPGREENPVPENAGGRRAR